MKLILASASPRRAALLRQVKIPFIVVAPEMSEEISGSLTVHEMVTNLALRKAHAVAKKLDRGLVLAADTVVLHRGLIMGKPADRDDARLMLSRLSGDKHEVATGMALVDAASGRFESAVSITAVWFKHLSDMEIDAYVMTGDPLDKAGAYGIQGPAALFVEKIEGCFFNVVGLPLNQLYDLLLRMQMPIWLNRKDCDNDQ
jgi:septum formation protein